MTDPFRLNEIARVQSGLLDHLEASTADIAVKIAALRATADLMEDAVSAVVLATQIRDSMLPRC